MIIYKATNNINGKVYIGQTIKTLDERRRGHIRQSKYGKRQTYFTKALAKYGSDNFSWEIIDTALSQDELNKKESYWIEKLKTTNNSVGYNLKGGGHNPFLTDKVKKKIGDSQRGEKSHRYGKSGELSPTSKPVINLTTGTKYISATECSNVEGTSLSKICAVCRGDRFSTNYCVYRYLDDDGDIIEPNQVKMTKKHTSVINLTTGERFDTIKAAAKAYGHIHKDENSSNPLQQALRNRGGLAYWADCKWTYEHLEFSQEEIDSLTQKKQRSDSQQILNATTGEIFPSIRSVGKNATNLAAALRKGKGSCMWRNQKWKKI